MTTGNVASIRDNEPPKIKFPSSTSFVKGRMDTKMVNVATIADSDTGNDSTSP